MKSALILLLLPLFALARPKGKPFVAFSSYEFTHPVTTNVKKVAPNGFTTRIIARDATGRHRYPIDSVWGFGDGKNSYRIYNGALYTVMQADTMCIYTHHSGKSRRYCFSLGIDGDIRKLGTRVLNRTFAATNPAFLDMVEKQISWYQDYEKYDNKHNTYKIVALYKQSISH